MCPRNPHTGVVASSGMVAYRVQGVRARGCEGLGATVYGGLSVLDAQVAGPRSGVEVVGSEATQVARRE